MATAGGNNLGPPPILSHNSPLHPHQPTFTHIIQQTSQPQPSSSTSGPVATIPIGGGVTVSGTNGLRESQAPNPGDLSGIFSVVLNRQNQQNHHQLPHHVRWPSFSMGNRSFWTKYCLLCTVCGSAATILAGIFLVVAALFRYYTTSIYYFETVPTYIPAILLSICGVSTIAFSCKRNRNIILLRITACWSLCSAALSSVITITTSLIHMNRLQTLKECVYTKNPPSCTCYSHSFGMQGPGGPETTHYLFENTPDCDVIHGILYSCLRAVFAISVVAVLLSIFLCMLLYQLIGHERKKAYWSRIRRINSDWSADFIACLARPMPRERSSLLPLMPSMMPAGGNMPMHGPAILPPPGWGPPPSYDDACSGDGDRHSRHIGGLRSGLCGPSIQPTHSFAGTSSGGFTGGGFFNNRSSASFAFHGGHNPPPRRLRLVTSHSENSFRGNPDGLMCPHPFSPTITVDPVSIFKQHVQVNQHHHNNHNNHANRHPPNYRHNPGGNCTTSTLSNCSIARNDDYFVGDCGESPQNESSTNHGRNFRSLSQSQVLQHSTEEDDCYMNHSCHEGHRHHSRIPQSASFHTTASGRNSEFSITSLSIPDNSSMSITMKSSNEIPLNDNTSSSHCCNINQVDGGNNSSLTEDEDFVVLNNYQIEESGFSDQEISLTSSTNGTTSAEVLRHHHSRKNGNGGNDKMTGCDITTSSSFGAVGLASNLNCVGSSGKKSTHYSTAPSATTSSEPKMINANKTNSFNTVVRQTDSNVINSDTDIILNKKALEFWGSLKKHKNFTYYGGGNSTSRRRRKDKSKSSLSKISSLPSSPFMNMRRKLFGTGGKSLECVQNVNYNYSCNITPMEVADLLINANLDYTNGNKKNADVSNSDEAVRSDDCEGNSEGDEKCSEKVDIMSRNKASKSDDEKVSLSDASSAAEVRP